MKNQTRILRIEDVCLRTALSRSQIFRMVKSRVFPQPVKLCLRASGWVDSEVEQWIQERISKGRSAA